jgi:hypothetical protein
MGDKIRTADGTWVVLGDRLAQVTPQGAMCTLPVAIGTAYPNTPQSPIYIDSAIHLRSLILETEGTVTIKFSRSLTTDEPANIDAIEAARIAGDPVPAPDMSNHDGKWIRLTGSRGIDFHEGGFHEVPTAILRATKGRWLKVDPVGGDFATMKIHPTIAGY